jgi:hypothetical protein
LEIRLLSRLRAFRPVDDEERDDMWEEDEVGGEGEGRIESAPRREVIMLPSRLSERSEGRRESVVGIVLRRFWERSRETKEGRGRGGKERRESLMNAKWERCGKLGFGGSDGGEDEGSGDDDEGVISPGVAVDEKRPSSLSGRPSSSSSPSSGIGVERLAMLGCRILAAFFASLLECSSSAGSSERPEKRTGMSHLPSSSVMGDSTSRMTSERRLCEGGMSREAGGREMISSLQARATAATDRSARCDDIFEGLRNKVRRTTGDS